MKKVLILLALVSCVLCLFCSAALAEGLSAVATGGETQAAPLPKEPFSWEYLATIAGATVATMLIVQLLKLPMDKVWKIPTRIVVYLIALIISLLATAFTTGITVENGLLTAVNAVIVALAAMGGYEVLIRRLENKTEP